MPSGPCLGAKPRAKDGFLFMDSQIQKLEAMIGSKFSCIVAPFYNESSIFAPIFCPLEKVNDGNLEGKTIFACLPTNMVDRVLPTFHEAYTRDPNTSVVIALSHDKGARYDLFAKEWTRLYDVPKG
jgi:hypothetical protein